MQNRNYCVHQKGEVEDEDAHRRAHEHDEEQKEIGGARETKPQDYIPGNRQCLLSVHVHDIEGCARTGIG